MIVKTFETAAREAMADTLTVDHGDSVATYLTVPVPDDMAAVPRSIEFRCGDNIVFGALSSYSPQVQRGNSRRDEAEYVIQIVDPALGMRAAEHIERDRSESRPWSPVCKAQESRQNVCGYPQDER